LIQEDLLMGLGIVFVDFSLDSPSNLTPSKFAAPRGCFARDWLVASEPQFTLHPRQTWLFLLLHAPSQRSKP
jgi:hypothetical protein